MAHNPISTGLQRYKAVTINPVGHSALMGTAAFGLGALGWNRATETARSLLRTPIHYMTGMSYDDFDKEVDDIKNDKKMRYIIPGSVGAGIMGLSLLFAHRPNEEWGGLLHWNAKPNGKMNSHDMGGGYGYVMPGSQNLTKTASAMNKLASDIFNYSGYVPPFDFSQQVNVPYAKQEFFTNDPFLKNDPYAMNFGKAILTSAQMQNGASNVPMGTIYDTAVDKFKTKFSLGGVMGVAAKTMFANTAARLFTTALGAVTGLSKENQDRIVEAGTWAGAIKSIIS